MRRRSLFLVAAILTALACQAPGPWARPVDPASIVLRDSEGRLPEQTGNQAASPHADCAEAPAPGQLYHLTPTWGGAALRPLDPESLADQPGCAWLPNQGLAQPFGGSRRSDDGSLVATIESEQQPAGAPYYVGAVVVRDALTGEERSRFSPPGPFGSELHLSPDGAWLLVQGWYVTWRPDAVAWYAVDTASGELRATLLAERGIFSQPFFAGKGAILYRLISQTAMEPGGPWPPAAPTPPGPWPTEIVAHDLQADGAEVARLVLPGVRAGTWWSERTINGQPIPAGLMPGAALAPDGRRLALAHADEDVVTIVDLDGLEVQRTVTASGTQTVAQTPLERLGLAPRAALAKGMDGHTRQARYVQEGRALLVWGGEMRLEANGSMTEHAAPLRLFDLERGGQVAALEIESATPDLLLSRDGKSLYVGTPRKVEAAGAPRPGPTKATAIVRRVDLTNLAMLAQRELRNGPGRLYRGGAPLAGPGGPLILREPWP
jgi:hypothetical protein